MSGWAALTAAAEAPTAELRAAIENPRGAQERFLAAILETNAASKFGRRHRFSEIDDADAYRSRVPVSTYDDLRDAIERVAAGAAGVLTCAPAVAFEETGGSSRGRKLAPYTQESLAAFRRAVLPWLADLVARRPGVAAGKAYVAISPATRAQTFTAGGLPIGLGSDAAYLGADLAAAFASLLATPPQVGALACMADWRRETLRSLVACEALTFVSVWSPTFFLELVEAIPAHADAIAPTLDAQARARLATATRGGRLDAAVLWPRLDTVSCWLDGASRIFAERLAAALPHARLEPKGLLATETPATIPWGGREGCIPALNSVFLEFVGSDGAIRLTDEVEAGESYRTIVTTPGGLYRYDLGDQLRCVGFEGATPRFVFEGRSGLTSDLVGEKLTDAFVAQALSSLPAFATLAACAEDKPRYEIWSEAPLTDAQAAEVDAALRANPQYAYARDLGQLGPPILRLRPDLRAALTHGGVQAGRRLGDIKATALLTTDQRTLLVGGQT